MANVVLRGQVTGPRRVGLLPAEATGFVGRTAELAGIASLLASARMVTVVGSAGVGKTRISMRAAAEAADRYPDGVWVADLDGTSDPGQFAGAVAAALGLQERDNDAWMTVLRHMRGRKLLLVLDTCEHLVDACAAFADALLRAAAGVTLIATSRQPLDAPGEHAFPLLPLAGEEAVQLFTQRAAAVSPGFTITPENRADIERLCRRLDCVPLAIEFAAVRLRALPLPELVSQVETGIRMLTVSRRGTSPRHQTLWAAVEWSYRLCTPAERTLWQRLSVFAETFDVSGAESVCSDGLLPREQVVHALVGLVDKSVVLRDDADPSRYRLLGALREFGADRLADTGERERFLHRLAAWSLAGTVARHLNGARVRDEQGVPHRDCAHTRTVPGTGATAGDSTDEGDEPPGAREGETDQQDGGDAAADGPRDVSSALTRREREIAGLVASGLSNREIAARLFISKRTVDAHVDHIFSKLEISSRVQLTVLLREPARQTS